jgi:hypothetical protein
MKNLIFLFIILLTNKHNIFIIFLLFISHMANNYLVLRFKEQ